MRSPFEQPTRFKKPPLSTKLTRVVRKFSPSIWSCGRELVLHRDATQVLDRYNFGTFVRKEQTTSFFSF